MATIVDRISKGSRNRLVRSEGFDDSGKWTRTGTMTVTANDAGTLDPLGGNTAELFADTDAAAASSLFQEVLAAELTANAYYTFSVYLKPSTAAKSALILNHQGGSGESVTIEVDWASLVATKTLGGTQTFSAIDLRNSVNGFYRLSATIRWVAGANTKLRCLILAAGTTVASTGSVWVWGAQFEAGPYATSYYPVTGTTDPLVGAYRTPDAWASATASDLTNIRVGQLADEEYRISSEILLLNRAGSTSTVYRRLEPAPGVGAYNPVTNTGPRLVCAYAAGSVGAKLSAVRISENFFDLNGVGIFLDFSVRGTDPDLIGIRLDGADFCRIWDCFISMERGGGEDLSLANDRFLYGVYIDGSSADPAVGNSFFNVIVKGAGPRANRGCDLGFYYGFDARFGGFYNCLVYGCASRLNTGGFFSAHLSSAHPLTGGAIQITNVGATASQNGNGDSQVRIRSTATGPLAVGDALSISGATGTYTVVTAVTFFGTTLAPDTQNVTITPNLSGIGGTGVLVENAAISPTGVGQAASSAEVVNCIAVDGRGGGMTGFWRRARNNITTDTSAIAGGIEGAGSAPDPLSRSGATALTLFLSPDAQNFLPRPGGFQLDAGSNEAATFNAARSATSSGGPGDTTDLYGRVRAPAGSGAWDVGPYEGTVLTPIHQLSGMLVVTTTGATASQNGNGDSQVRIKSIGNGLLDAGDTLAINGATGTYRVVNPVYFLGSASSSDTQNVTVTPVLAGISGASLVDAAEIAPTSGDSFFALITKTVGLDRSRDFVSVGAFVAALPRSLANINQRWRAIVYNDGVDVLGETIEVDYFRAITGPANYVDIQASLNYSPRSGQGPSIQLDLEVDATTRHRAVLWATSNWLRLTGLAFRQAASSTLTTKNPRVVELWGDDITVNACTGLFNGTFTRFIGTVYEVEGSRLLFTNTIARGSNTLGQGASRGFEITADSRDVRFLHCIAYRIRGGTDTGGVRSACGFLVGARNSNAQVSGCAALETDTSGTGGKFDFAFGSGVTALQTIDHCFSGDTTAVGPGSQVSLAAATVFTNAPNNDFRLPKTSPAINAGANHSRVFGTDLVGNPRFAPYDVGVFEGVAFAPLLASPRPRDHHRHCQLVELTRSDGVNHFFCSVNEPIDHRGQTYSPLGQTTISARRMEAALREHNVEVQGAVVLNEIDAADLAAGVFRGARVVMRTIDWRFPWTNPFRTRVYTVGSLNYDADLYTAELVGPTAKLDQETGEVIGVDCPYEVFDEDCQLLAALFREPNKTITVVNDARREFTCSGLANGADDYYGKGRMTVLDGPNAGLEVEVKTYVGASKTLRLLDKLPYDLTAGTRFDILPGCRRRWLKDCVGKYNNGINFGGRPLMPGTDAAMETATR